MRLSEKINGLETTKFLNILKESEELNEYNSIDYLDDMEDKLDQLFSDLHSKGRVSYTEDAPKDDFYATWIETIRYMIGKWSNDGLGLRDFNGTMMPYAKDLVSASEGLHDSKLVELSKAIQSATKNQYSKAMAMAIDYFINNVSDPYVEETTKTIEDQLERNWEKNTKVGIEESEELIIDDEKELAKYIAAHYEEITGVQLEDLFNKAEIEDSSEPIFNQSVIDETFDKIVNFIKDYNESNGTNYDSNDEDFLDLLDDELLKRREPMEESTEIHKLNDEPDDNFRIYYKDDEGNLYCDMFGTLYSCTEVGEPIAPVENQEEYELMN